MNNVLTREQAAQLRSEVERAESSIRGLARSARYYLFTRPGRWAATNPNAALGVVAGLGLAIGLTVGFFLWRR